LFVFVLSGEVSDSDGLIQGLVYITGYPVLQSSGAAERKHDDKQLPEDLTLNTLCISDMFWAASDFQHNCVIPVKSQLSQTFSSMMSLSCSYFSVPLSSKVCRIAQFYK
jgi:hypothetical protein